MSKQCRCKRGHCGADGKCAHCRTKREQQAWLNRPEKFLHLRVVNKHHGETGIYIGRGSPLGNPHHIQGGITRDMVIERYEVWLQEQIDNNNPIVINELQRIANLAIDGPVKLQCFCAPQACHGHVISNVLLKAVAKTYPDYRWSLRV